MKKSKILGVALCAAMITSVAALSVSADATDKEEIKNHQVGLVGSFNGWADDVPMTDDDGDGVYEGTIKIDSVTEDMIVEAMTDPGDGTSVSRGFSGVQFKVRLDGAWGLSWGDYEKPYIRTQNSQTNCCVKDAVVGKGLEIYVKLDTNNIVQDEDAIDAFTDGSDNDAYQVWPVTYEAKVIEAAGTTEESKAEESKADDTQTEESKADDTKTEESKDSKDSKDETPVATGDTTSAVALVAVVVASLGAAVVMTKKASSKE